MLKIFFIPPKQSFFLFGPRGTGKSTWMKAETDYEVTEGNVFAALGRENAEELLARAKLLDEVSTLIKKSGLTQKKIAKNLE